MEGFTFLWRSEFEAAFLVVSMRAVNGGIRLMAVKMASGLWKTCGPQCWYMKLGIGLRSGDKVRR